MTYLECKEKALELFKKYGPLHWTNAEIGRKLGVQDKEDIKAVAWYLEGFSRRKKEQSG